MARTKISEFSATPANNTDIDSINIAEGCAPSGINDAIRELMAQLKDFQTGAVGDSFNGPIGSTSAVTGAFTTLSATGAITSTLATGSAPLVIASTTKVANLNVDLLDGADWASPAALGSTTPAAVSATTLTTSSTVTLSGGTANGVAYLNGSKVVTSGSALTFDGTEFGFTRATAPFFRSTESGTGIVSYFGSYSVGLYLGTTSNHPIQFIVNSSEQMRLTSTGLGIGTSSPDAKLTISQTASAGDMLTLKGANSVNGALGVHAFSNGGVYLQAASTRDVRLRIGSTDYVTLNSGGDLGLGYTPSTWYSTFSAFQFGGNGSSLFGRSENNMAAIGSNVYVNAAGSNTYINTNTASYYQQLNGQHQFYTAPSGTAGTGITFTQAMTLTAAGNLGVGVTSPTYKIDLGFTNTTIGWYLSASYSGAITYSSDARSMTLATKSADSTDFIAFGTGTAATERARIDSSGNLLIGTTSASITNGGIWLPPGGGSSSIQIGHASGTASGNTYANFGYSSNTIGSITQNGTTGVLYNLTSDYRLKNNPQALTGAKDFVMALQPKKWQWWDGSGEGVGFIAHEFMEVAKHSGTGVKDAVDDEGKPIMQSIQPSSSEVMANLVSLIQEQQAIIESLKARLDAANL